MLIVTTPATDLTLLTVTERRAAVGATDASQDVELATLEARVAAAITGVCKVARGGAVPPTLRSETLTETLRPNVGRYELILSRRPITSIVSVTEDGAAVGVDDYEIDAAAGIVRRMSSDVATTWAAARNVIVYVAGWATVPQELKLAASKLMMSYWTEGGREPGLRSEDIPGVYSGSYQDKESDNPAIPNDVMQILSVGGFVNTWIG